MSATDFVFGVVVGEFLMLGLWQLGDWLINKRLFGKKVKTDEK